MTMHRRDFLGAAAAALAPALAAAAGGRPKTILLRSGWQTINIGDIGHTPGALRLFADHLPGTRVVLWPNDVGGGVREMLLREFPALTFADGGLDDASRPATAALRSAFAEADLMVHGSGPSVVAQKQLAAWRKATGKPYGVLGVTVGGVDADLRDLLSGAAFVYLRDTVSLGLLRKAGVKGPVLGFGPDATFAIRSRDDAAAAAYLKKHGLEDRKFVCAVPRLRYTPYHTIRGLKVTDEWRRKDAVNAETKERDHAKLREALVEVVRATGLRVLACPEMTYEVAVAKELIVDPLPADVKKHVVWRDTYWGPDEAGAVYARAHSVVSFEMHSPIIAAAAGTPAVHLRQPTDTSKGQMWRDIGLDDWLFEIDDATGPDIAKALTAIHADYPAARAKLASAMDRVRRLHAGAMAEVAKAMGA